MISGKNISTPVGVGFHLTHSNISCVSGNFKTIGEYPVGNKVILPSLQWSSEYESLADTREHSVEMTIP